MAHIGNETLDQLEWRVNRLEFYLKRTSNQDDRTSIVQNEKKDSVQERVAKVESRFRDLCKHSPAVAQLVDLIESQPELVKPHDDVTAEDTDFKVPILMSMEKDIHETASHLHLMQGSPVLDGGDLLALLELQPRLARAAAIAEAQSEELFELRRRTARLLTEWYTNSVLDQGNQWSEWENRIGQVERDIRRKEVQRNKEEQM